MDIKTPTFSESIKEGTVAAWHRQVGEPVRRDDVLVDIETDKVTLEIPAPADGVLLEIVKGEGETVESEDVLARFEERAEADDAPPGPPAEAGTAAAPVAAAAQRDGAGAASPAARKLAAEAGLDIGTLAGSGRDGRVMKEDVVRAASAAAQAPPEPEAFERTAPSPGAREERRVPMTRLRRSIAERLVEAQRTAAMLTTFNEVDMAPVMALRRRHGEEFAARHDGARLGFMSFFVRASVEALKRFPAVNASIDGTDVVYHGYYDIGVAVSTERGLVVPVLRDADALALHQIEAAIAEYGDRAQAGRLGLSDIQGGTFTVSNGGVFGSLLSTPILNAPQTAILGMHKIEQRPVVVDGDIVARPMMYLALSYDHRLIDGREAVQFLATVKALIEEPARILLDI